MKETHLHPDNMCALLKTGMLCDMKRCTPRVSACHTFEVIVVCMIAGYLLYDTTNMLAYYKYLGDKSAIIHHVIFACAAAYVLRYSIMAYPFIWLSLCEISTPSLNLRWVRHKDLAHLLQDRSPDIGGTSPACDDGHVRSCM